MTKPKFFLCKQCGSIVQIITEGNKAPANNPQDIQELIPNTVDAAQEKHVPVVTVEGNLVHVAVGSVAHPMLPEHYIQFIYLQTAAGGQMKTLKPGDKPEATFALTEGDKAVAAYEYCNLHGLWLKEI
ncbi:MAG: desulfoferrodoxin family protein [Phascolarctobacterium sp.]|uniref:desulfoferrodoxin family protein n=1 Tax=Phascolarctobacterium sp. TaxID=2049039 RepID=UPI0026DB7190|nr:desulfoferrodoxin family protein [Phascolarctobacterium sp.]MDO4920850.1 desulfoferrodoxin family protein [Phascolarctobacterium sp.]